MSRAGAFLRERPLMAAVALFAVLRLSVVVAVFLVAGGAEVSSDVRYYMYLAEHPFAVLTGENLAARGGDVAVLSDYGPLLGPALGGPIALVRRVLPDFFAVRAALICWEAAGLVAAYAAARRLARDGKGFSSGGSRTRFLMLAAALPLGWAATSAWPQDEIILAPFVFLAFAAAAADRPAASAWAIGIGVLGSKYYALAFIPAVWLTCRRRARFLLWAAAAAAPIVAWVAYLRLAHGVVPLVEYDVEVSMPFTISLFSLHEYAGDWLGVGTPPGWLGVVSKVTLVAALAAVAVRFYYERRSAGAAEVKGDVRVWGAFGATMLLVNAMGQPEYLAWFAYLAPFALVVLLRGRRLAVAAAGLTTLALTGWVWNVASAVANWAVLPGDGARVAFARGVTAWLGTGGIAVLEVGAAFLYLGGLAYVAAAALRKPRLAARDPGELETVGLYTGRE
jgi:hypothetical protein